MGWAQQHVHAVTPHFWPSHSQKDAAPGASESRITAKIARCGSVCERARAKNRAVGSLTKANFTIDARSYSCTLVNSVEARQCSANFNSLPLGQTRLPKRLLVNQNSVTALQLGHRPFSFCFSHFLKTRGRCYKTEKELGSLFHVQSFKFLEAQNFFLKTRVLAKSD